MKKKTFSHIREMEKNNLTPGLAASYLLIREQWAKISTKLSLSRSKGFYCRNNVYNEFYNPWFNTGQEWTIRVEREKKNRQTAFLSFCLSAAASLPGQKNKTILQQPLFHSPLASYSHRLSSFLSHSLSLTHSFSVEIWNTRSHFCTLHLSLSHSS